MSKKWEKHLAGCVHRRANERDEAQSAARYLLTLAQFPSAEERLQFIESNPWLREEE